MSVGKEERGRCMGRVRGGGGGHLSVMYGRGVREVYLCGKGRGAGECGKVRHVEMA